MGRIHADIMNNFDVVQDLEKENKNHQFDRKNCKNKPHVHLKGIQRTQYTLH